MNKNYILNVVLFILLNICHISCLMVVLERNKEYCINKDIESGDTLKFSFMVSGEKEDSIDIQLKRNDKVVYSNQDSNNRFKDNDDFSIDVYSKSILIIYSKLLS